MMIERLTGLARPSGWLTIVLVTFTGCSTAEGDTDRSTLRSTAEAASPDASPDASNQATERASPPACLPAVGLLEADASLEGWTGEYLLTMVEKVDTSQSRSVEGSLTLLPQSEDLRQFSGSAGGSIPGVNSPLYGSTDIRLEGVGAVRVGDLSSVNTEAPGVLVIESRTDVGPTILLRFGSDANRRELLRFDGGFTVCPWLKSRTKRSLELGLAGHAGPRQAASSAQD
jgi:hypothetical protein